MKKKGKQEPLSGPDGPYGDIRLYGPGAPDGGP